MPIFRPLILLALLTWVVPCATHAGVYSLRVAQTIDSTNRQDLVLIDRVEVFEFFNVPDYDAARLAYDDFQMKFRAFDRAIREERKEPTDERHQRYLLCRHEFHEATGRLRSALFGAKR